LLAPTAAAKGAPELPGPKTLPLALVKFIVPVEALLAPAAPVAFPPIAIPFIVSEPVEALFAPKAAAFDPPVTFPVIFMVPVDKFKTPKPVAPEPPVKLPVIFIIPVVAFIAPAAKVTLVPPVPPVRLPVIVTVPVEFQFSPGEFIPPPVILPIKAAEIDPEPLTHGAVPANTFDVNVIPLLILNNPPVVAPPVVSLRISPTVVFTLSVMVNEFAIKTSEDVNVENTSTAVPLGVVAQTSAALMLPALRAK
jgi:hypothetical protein